MAKNNNNMRMPKFSMTWAYLIVILILSYLFYTNSGNGASFQKEVTYTEFQTYVDRGFADRIVVNKGDGNVRMYVKKDSVGEVFPKASEAGEAPSVTAEFPSVEQVDQFIAAERAVGHFRGNVSYDSNSNFLGSLFMNIVLPIFLFIGIWMFIIRRSGGGGGGGIF